MRADIGASSNRACGVVGDVMELAPPFASMASNDFCTDQLFIGGLSLFRLLTESSQVGGEMWWWTSMRCGLACANAFDTKPEEAAAPSASVAAPPTKRRRRSRLCGKRLCDTRLCDTRLGPCDEPQLQS